MRAIGTVFVLLLASVLYAQMSNPQGAVNPSTPTTRATARPQVASGAEIRATLDKTLSTKTSRVGDKFTATVQEPVRGTGEAVAIPAGSKVEGSVTEVQQGKEIAALRGQGKLNMRFNRIVTPDGHRYPITATLVSLHETQGKAAKTNEEGEVTGGTTGKQAAKNVGIGAGAGTIAGLIFGHAMRGLAIGAIAGGGYVLANRGKDVEIPERTGLTLRLDRPLGVGSSTRGSTTNKSSVPR